MISEGDNVIVSFNGKERRRGRVLSVLRLSGAVGGTKVEVEDKRGIVIWHTSEMLTGYDPADEIDIPEDLFE